MSEQLKPCPFCGDVPELPSGAGTQYEIECDGCGQAMASVQICDLMIVEERAADNFTNYRYAEEFVERAKHQAVENWNRRADDAALAAKDARIAELEQRLTANAASSLDTAALEQALDEVCGESGNAVPVGIPLYSITLPEIIKALYLTGYANPAATPSEDGGEVPEIVGKFCWMDEDMGDGYYVQCVHDLPEHIIDNERELMTVAQHSRIVAEKDAEIARLKSDNEKRATMDRYCMVQRRLREQAEEAFKFEKECREEVEAELNELRLLVSAQPARRVGGGELRQASELLVELAGMLVDKATFAECRDPESNVSKMAIKLNEVDALISRAALAPAAVVMPDRLTWEQGRKPHARANAEGWNAALDEVARLNRRAIPEGLLERVAFEVIGLEIASGLNAYATDELRALLGNVE